MDFFDQALLIRQKYFVRAGNVGSLLFVGTHGPMWFYYDSLLMGSICTAYMFVLIIVLWLTVRYQQIDERGIKVLYPCIFFLVTLTCLVTWHFTWVAGGFYLLLVLFSAAVHKSRLTTIIYSLLCGVLIIAMPWLNQYSDLSDRFVEILPYYNAHIYIAYIALTVVFIFSSEFTLKLTMGRLHRSKISIQESRLRLQEAQRYRDLFFAAVNHEIRNPTQIIFGLVELLTLQNNLGKESRELLNRLDKASQHLLAMVNDFLSLRQFDHTDIHLQKVNIDVSEFMRSILQMMQPRAQAKGLQLTAVLPTDEQIIIHTDDIRLRQILINLLNNAIKFTHEGGVRIVVKRANLPISIPERILKFNPVAPIPRSMQLEFRVMDTGPGIDSRLQDALFDSPPLQTPSTISPMDGFGLGLYISHTLVQKLGGEIQVESTSESGTCILFWLPCD